MVTTKQASIAECLVQNQLLHAQIADLAHIERICIPAVDGVHGSELFRQLAGPTKLADHGSVQLHFVDFTIAVDIVGRVGIRDVKKRTRSLGHTQGLGVPNPRIGRLKVAVVVENLNSLVTAVGHVDVALRINRDAPDIGELAVSGSVLTPRLYELA